MPLLRLYQEISKLTFFIANGGFLRSEAAALKHGIRKRERNHGNGNGTEYGIKYQ